MPCKRAMGQNQVKVYFKILGFMEGDLALLLHHTIT